MVFHNCVFKALGLGSFGTRLVGSAIINVGERKNERSEKKLTLQTSYFEIVKLQGSINGAKV